MPTYRRQLPHVYEAGQPLFITWRLQGSLPVDRFFHRNLTSGEEFAAMDKLLDKASTGPKHLSNPEVANIVMQSLYFGETLDHYKLHAFAVMSNHVHVLITPLIPLPKLMQSLKGFSARRANLLLGLTGAFWQKESYDHLVRNDTEFIRIKRYIENNPVRAGLASTPEAFLWSSAGAVLGPPADCKADPRSAVGPRTTSTHHE